MQRPCTPGAPQGAAGPRGGRPQPPPRGRPRGGPPGPPGRPALALPSPGGGGRSARGRGAVPSRSGGRLPRLPGPASAEPAAVHVAAEPRERGQPSRARGGGGRGAGRRRRGGPGAGAGRGKGRAPQPRRLPAPRCRPGSGSRPPARPAGPSRSPRGKVFPRPLPASPRLRAPASPAELHYARQFRHFAETKTGGRRARRPGRKRRRRRRRGPCERAGGARPGLPPTPLRPEPPALQPR